ncbi:MAG: ABC transporter substrate-binding protein [Candidatus Lindowbacteria bacterium]|nr:ABC transporter substrate-binding protein [Candidatus Lindowbacteria bacterium]
MYELSRICIRNVGQRARDCGNVGLELLPDPVPVMLEAELRIILMNRRIIISLLSAALLITVSCGKTSAPSNETSASSVGRTAPMVALGADGRKINPIANPDALKGGQITVFSGPTPKSLNYYLDNNNFSAEVFGGLYDSLMSLDPMTYEFAPGIAEKWVISEDGLTFTFHLDANAKWSDGEPITSEDIAWTYKTIMDPKNLTGVHKVGLQRFEPPKVIDEKTIEFKAKEAHWKNLLELSSLAILPKHEFQGKDFNKINFEFDVVSGPYRIDEFKENRYVDLKRRDDWWQKNYSGNIGMYNFDIVRHRMIEEREDAYQLFLKGEIDLYLIYTSRIWVNETKGEKFEKNWIAKQKVFNYEPQGFQGWAMNMRKPPFNDLRVRKAMAYLVDRDKMNERMMYNQYFMHRSYYEDLYDDENINSNEKISFDPAKARALLSEAGWNVNNKGKLTKDGKPFVIHFLLHSKSITKFTDMFREDVTPLGIDVKIEMVDGAEFFRRMDETKFQICWMAWSASVFKDPESMWHSKYMDVKGNNKPGFKNAKVDELIEKQKTIYDIQERNDIVREIDSILYKEHPYAMLWNINYTRLLYWNKFGTPSTVLNKYSNESAATAYWWFDPEKSAELKDAREANEPLPPVEYEIRFAEKIGR